MKFTKQMAKFCEEYKNKIGLYFLLDDKENVTHISSSKRLGWTLSLSRRNSIFMNSHKVRVALIDSEVDAQIYTLLYRAIFNTNGVKDKTKFIDVSEPTFLPDIVIFERSDFEEKRSVLSVSRSLTTREIHLRYGIPKESITSYCRNYSPPLNAKKMGSCWIIDAQSVPLLLKIRKWALEGRNHRQILGLLSPIEGVAYATS